MTSTATAQPTQGETFSVYEAFRLALSEGHRGYGSVSPNPLVGCVILDRDFRLLATGYHKKAGQDHAEIDALKKIPNQDRLIGAHVFVTLEPCAHQGRTPSCAKTLAPLKLASVNYLIEDPNPLVSGQGAAVLRQAGVQTSRAIDLTSLQPHEKQELILGGERLAEVFLYNMREKAPFVGLKIASSLDGVMALKSGESKWITGSEAREHVHYLRAGYDAIAVGSRTFLLDDPSLNVRHTKFIDHENKVVVFDPRGKSLHKLQSSGLIRVRKPESIFILVAAHLDAATISTAPAGVQVVPVSVGPDGLFDLDEALYHLSSKGLQSIMIEGGASVYGAFLTAKRAQRLHLFQAPVLLGAKQGLSWGSEFGVTSMTEKIKLEGVETEFFGNDMYLTGRILNPG